MSYIDNHQGRYRSLNFLGLAIAAGALLFAIVYLQQRLGLTTCLSCMVSRIIVLAIAAIFLLAWLHNPRQLGQRFYALLGGLLSLSGVAVNLRHIWLSNTVNDTSSNCNHNLTEMLPSQPLAEVINAVFNDNGNCIEANWSLLGMPLTQLTLIVFMLLICIQLLQFRKKRQRHYFK